MLPAIVVLAVLILLGLFFFVLYNGLVRARNMADEGWSGIEVQLKRRRDLIPNLVSTVQGYAAHERQTFDAVTQARANAEQAAGGPAQGVPAENVLTAAMTGLFGVAEAYPDLKASANFLQLQGELSSIEDNLAGARGIYNGNARNYNDKIQAFPAMLIASPLGFQAREYFEATKADYAPAKVNF